MKVAVIFDRFGPYHVARLDAASRFVSLIPIELFGQSSEYQWDKVKGPTDRITLFQNESKDKLSTRKLFSALQLELSKQSPDAVAINGWSDPGALSALYWCLKNSTPVIVMSESTAMDERRTPLKEFVKRLVVRLCTAGLVGGSRHVSYLAELGMDRDAIFTGYDVIDNDYFQNKVAHIRSQERDEIKRMGLPHNYFLASSRFIPKKNLLFLIEAYAAYREQAHEQFQDLVILGDGELRHELKQLINKLSLQPVVHLPGFKQYGELPYYYAFASAFIHSSTSEQWGLVVNEAMAAGLPVVVSERCGCVPELVQQGVNGFSFDPFDAPALTNILLTISDNENKLRFMGLKSREIIANWKPDAFGKGLQKAAKTAVASPRKSFSFFERLFLKLLILR